MSPFNVNLTAALGYLRTHPKIPGASVIASRFVPAVYTTLPAFLKHVLACEGKNIVIFVRHGDVAGASRIYSSGGDLTPLGRIQMEQLGHLLRGLKKLNPNIFSSDLPRALQSNGVLAGCFEVPEAQIKIRRTLGEIGVGELKGKPFTPKELLRDPGAIPLISRLAWSWIFSNSSFGYPGGERTEELWDRIGQALTEIVPGAREQLTIVVGHDVSHRTAIAQLLGYPIKEMRMAPIVPKAGFVALELNDSGPVAILYRHDPNGNSARLLY